MSIITDALKKAESERELKAKRISEDEKSQGATLIEEEIFPQFSETEMRHQVEIEEKPIFEVKKFFHKYNPAWKFTILILTIAFSLLGFSILMLVPKKTVLIVESDKNHNIQKQISRAISSSIQSNSLKLPYALSGISELGNSQYAIINGMIVQQGETIDGAHVREILDSEVVLETRAGEIRLKIK